MSIASMIDRYGRVVLRGTKTVASDAVGGSIETWTYSGATKALVQIESTSDGVIGGRENVSKSATFFFKSGTEINLKDRIQYDSDEFEVRSVRTPHERPRGDAISYINVQADQVLS